MTFNKLHENTVCNCLEGSAENLNDTFARTVTKTTKVKVSDFKSYHECNKSPADDTCKSICSYRGVSVDIWNTVSQEAVFKRICKTFEISPGLKKVLLIFKMKQHAGKIAYTPNPENPFHHDLYKSDEFDAVTHIQFVNIVKPTNMT